MNAKRHNHCEICGRRTPKDWDGKPAKRCRAHRVLSESNYAVKADTLNHTSRSVFDPSVSVIFAAMAGVAAVIAEALLDSGNATNESDQEGGLCSDIGYYPGKEYDDVGKPLGWVGPGHVPDTDRYIGPGNK